MRQTEGETALQSPQWTTPPCACNGARSMQEMEMDETREEWMARTMLWMRNACRKVADQYDEFGTIYEDALDDLYNAEAAFWKAAETTEGVDGDEGMRRAIAEAIDWDRAFTRPKVSAEERAANIALIPKFPSDTYDDEGTPNPERDF